MFENELNNAIAYAEEVDSAKLLRAVENPERAWELLALLESDEDFPATTIIKSRTDVKTIKKNHTRAKDLARFIANEPEDSEYLKFYTAEKAILDIYAVKAFVDIFKADSTIFNHLDELQKIEDEKQAAKEAEREAKKAARKAEKEAAKEAE